MHTLNLEQILLVVFTAVIAISSCLSYGVQKQMAKTSDEMKQIAKDSTTSQIQMAQTSSDMRKIAEVTSSQDKARLQSELRPYLFIQLTPQQNLRRNENTLQNPDERFQIDDQSVMYFLKFSDMNYLELPFRIKNVGKIPAINIKAEYNILSTTQPFNLGNKGVHIAPNEETPQTYRPSINISTVTNDSKPFDFNIKITYQGLSEIESGTYISTLNFSVLKKPDTKDPTIFDVQDTHFEFKLEE